MKFLPAAIAAALLLVILTQDFQIYPEVPLRLTGHAAPYVPPPADSNAVDYFLPTADGERIHVRRWAPSGPPALPIRTVSTANDAPNGKAGSLEIMTAAARHTGTQVEAVASATGRASDNVQTVASAGLPGYESAATIGVLARTGTPAAVVNLLHREMARYLHSPEGRGRLLKAGIEAIGNTPAEFAAIIREDMRTKGKIIRDAGIRME